jgi:hypothetical protein
MQQGKCEAATVRTTCSASKKMREAAWRLCPTRARVGENCEWFKSSFDRAREDVELRALIKTVEDVRRFGRFW